MMTRPILFISDLHLSPADPATTDAFRQFLAGRARAASRLYILGDLFNAWIGDDQLSEPYYAAVAQDIKHLADAGVAVYFMPGNRDFLCGQRLARTAGLTILPDPATITLDDATPVLLAHGDAYCTDDASYMKFRRIVRSRWAQAIWLALPLRWRNRKAGQLRAQSSAANQAKMQSIMDVNAAAIEAALRHAHAQVLVHGHTHRPARHEAPFGTRWVLPDWYAGLGGYLQWQEGEWAMRTLANAPLLDETGQPLPDTRLPVHAH
ncbi:UDP-2,3-diacylglucosamine diphosphatase [Silvimonas iriomotensis]|uniref:UDP-2,3-diacylglucosamine hydrolase n=1 Tax=Silvimonas iriomotensis TaxID=449662 RepID=A0ABQ2P9V7_9NEIS|nr:UDP-2,3-diacylglucosamine diphosphatase [Silvimonas iriomotensis]GGP21675.1 UDP-2,3-diacylglucosamine hydrolase [Silvimonas iriomotensis]